MAEHIYYKCKQPCDEPRCKFCDGNLALCVVCNGGEAELLPTCPGYALTEEALDAVIDGTIKSVDDLKPEHRKHRGLR